MALLNNKWIQFIIVVLFSRLLIFINEPLGGFVFLVGLIVIFVPKVREMARLDNIVDAPQKSTTTVSKDKEEEVASENATQVEDSQTQIEADEKNNQETDNEIKQIDKTHDSDSKTVKDLIMESLEGALKEFISDPPDEAYSSGDGYFSWYINIRDNEDNTLSRALVWTTP